MPGAVKYIFIMLLLVSLVLLINGCSKTPPEISKKRAKLATQEDKLNNCKRYAKSEWFDTSFYQCQSFLEQDENCQFFQENNQDCQSFMSQTGYESYRYSCRTFMNIIRECDNSFNQSVWYSWAFQYKDNTLVNFLMKFTGVDLRQNWNHSAKFLYEEDYVSIGVVDDQSADRGFLQGIQLAVDNINRKQAVHGRKVKLIVESVKGSDDLSLKSTDALLDDIDIVGVIDSQQSIITKVAANMFEQSGIVHLVTAATDANILRLGMQYNFRLIPNNATLGRETAIFLANNGYRQIAVLMARNEASENLAQSFYDEAIKQGINVKYFKTIFRRRTDFAGIITDMAEEQVDAVFLATSWPDSVVDVMHQSRVMGHSFQFFGTLQLETEKFIVAAGIDGNGIVIPSVYNNLSKRKKNVQFVKSYKARYGILPNSRAALGYDAVYLLLNNIHQIDSSVPLDVASALRFITDWTGSTGVYNFTNRGELQARKVYFKELQQGEFNIVYEPEVETKKKVTGFDTKTYVDSAKNN